MFSSAVILPSTKSSKRDFVPPWDYRYEFLSGNRSWVTKKTCGKWAFRGCLESHKHGFSVAVGQKTLSGHAAAGYDVVKGYQMSCGRLDCPVCYEKAAAKQALKIENRILQYRRKGCSVKFYHWVVSPSKEDVARLSLADLWKKSYDVAKMAGVQGGCVIFHHLRRYREDDLEEDIEAGCSWKTAPAAWYISPHFHIIGVGYTSEEKVRAMYEKTGWVVKNLGERDSVRATALYQLSHAYIPEGRSHAVRWFGVMSYNKLKVEPLPKEDDEVCPVCGSPFRPLLVADGKAAIVEGIFVRDGIYRVSHGLFVYDDCEKPPWFRDGG